MKLGLRSRLYNAEVRNRRLQRQMTQGQLAKATGISSAMVCQIENLRSTNPATPSVLKIAAYFQVEPETLVPKWLKLITPHIGWRDAQSEFTAAQLENASPIESAGLLEAPEDVVGDVEQRELEAAVSNALSKLSFREREIIKLRYGIGTGAGITPKTYSEIAKVFKLTRERVRQIGLKALQKLQNPSRARDLRGFVISELLQNTPEHGIRREAKNGL